MFLIALSFLAINNVSAITVSHTFSATSATIDSNMSFITEKNSASAAPAFNTQLRLYYASNGNGCSLTLNPTNGATINEVKIYAVKNYAPTVKYNVDGGVDVDASLTETTYTITGIAASASLKIRNANITNTQLRITSIEVTYTTGSTTTVDAPSFTPVAGTYYGVQNVSLATSTDGATIYYTANGDAPTVSSTLYSSPIAVNSTTTLKAIAVKSGLDNSLVSTAAYTIITDPSILVAETSVASFYTTVGSTNVKTITVSGKNLTSDIALSLSGADAAQFKLSAPALSQSAGEVASTTVTITYEPTAAGSHTATLTLASTGASDKSFSLTSTSVWPAVSTPVAASATSVSSTGFTANWEASTNASSYDVAVYTKSGTKLTEHFDAGSTEPADWVFTGITSTYTSTGYFGMATPSIKFDTSDDEVETPLYTNAATAISFWLVGASTDANSAMLVEGSPDGISWTTIENIVPIATKGSLRTYNASSSPALASGYKAFRFTYTKSAGNAGLDDFSYMDNYTELGVVGSLFNTTNLTQAISDLLPETNYFYTVTAKSEHVTSSLSNEIAVTTSTTTSSLPSLSLEAVRYIDGAFVFDSNKNQTLDIYNATGQRLVSTQMGIGKNSIPFAQKGIFILKIANETTKVAL
ncbi:MAG: hypothetical protein AUK44_07030 [Porphyromonadaceae bacterium CG2_30_38_12]|nr:MAG: hypothetical protein AUK44_07030 [Porphyromonadaceae bacterium CG2_30_38_12]